MKNVRWFEHPALHFTFHFLLFTFHKDHLNTALLNNILPL